MSQSPYHRVLIKLSGEALAPKTGYGIDPDSVDFIADRIQQVAQLGVQVAVVIGGGNLWRGEIGTARGMDRTTADHMGMIATVMNGLALRQALERKGVDTRVMTAIEMNSVAEPYIRLRALRHLDKGRVIIFSGGTGNPFFTTDSGAALRASEIEADIIVKATKVDGVYDRDPNKDPNAVRYTDLTFQKVITDNLKVMDMTAFTMCQENDIPILVVNFWAEGDLVRAIQGDNSVGTIIHN
jgi:uridylate kinase